MNTKNNGKIAIGILVMFVVALSIIGVTYAYFTATFEGNQEPQSVTVNAGELIAVYEAGQSIDVSNVVPGWMSDGLHYYDVDVAAADGGHIYATKATIGYHKFGLDGEAAATGNDEDTKATDTMGIENPLTFTVRNSSRSADAVNYVIRLTVSENGIYKFWRDEDADATKKGKLNADRDYLYATIYSGTYEAGTTDLNSADLDARIVAGPIILPDSGETQVVIPWRNGQHNQVNGPLNIARGDSNAQDYFVVFGYKNDSTQEQFTKKASISAKVDIIGVSQDITGLTYAQAFEQEIIKLTDLVFKDQNENISDVEDIDDAEVGGTTDEKAVATALKNAIIAEYGSQTVWYDADNKPVIFTPTNSFITNLKPSVVDAATKKMCTETEAAVDGNTCYNSSVVAGD